MMPVSGRAGDCLLLDLPAALLFHVGSFVPCQDLPSVIATCRGIAAHSLDLYAACTELDMGLFPWVDPPLCEQLLGRLRDAQLRKLRYRMGIFKHAALWSPEALSYRSRPNRYSDAVEDAVLRRFPNALLDACHSERLIENLLYGRHHPRPMDVLVHALFLERFLRAHPGLRELSVDCETVAYFWPFKSTIQVVELVAASCPLLEAYNVRSTYMHEVGEMEAPLWRPQDSLPALLDSCRHLRHLSSPICLSGASSSVVRYLSAGRPLRLESAHVKFGRDEEWGAMSLLHLKALARRMPELRVLTITLGRRGWLPAVAALLANLASLQELTILPHEGAHSDQEDEAARALPGGAAPRLAGEAEAASLAGLYRCLPPGLKCLSLLRMPALEFDAIFGSVEGGLPEGVRSFRAELLQWPSDALTAGQLALLGSFRLSGHLQRCQVDISTGLQLHASELVFSVRDASYR